MSWLQLATKHKRQIIQRCYLAGFESAQTEVQPVGSRARPKIKRLNQEGEEEEEEEEGERLVKLQIGDTTVLIEAINVTQPI